MIARFLLGPVVLLLVACAPQRTLTFLDPQNTAEDYQPLGQDVRVDALITATLLADPPEDVNLRLAGAGGASVRGTLEVDGRVLTFEPETPLRPDTVHVARIDGLGALPFAWEFRTERLGDPLDEPGELDGRVFALTTYGWPGKVPELIDEIDLQILTLFYVANARLLFRLDGSALEKGVLGVRLGSTTYDSDNGTSSTPSRCVPRAELAGEWDDPSFRLSPQDAEVRAGYVALRLFDFSARGMLTPDADGIRNLALSFTVDTRDLHDYFDPPGDEAICPKTPGNFCAWCADGAQFCVTLNLEGGNAELAPEIDLPPLAAENIRPWTECIDEEL